MPTPVPTDIKLLQKQRVVEIMFDNHEKYILSCEYLRIHSPSAETRGHSDAPKPLLTNKADVNIVGIQPVGHYAVRFIFDDGHDSGLYSWDVLYRLAVNQK